MNDITKADPIGIIERAQIQERATAFMGALVKAQGGMEPIAKDMRNETTKSRYASLAALDRAIRPHYLAAGLAPTFNTRPSTKGEFWITIVGELVHTSGYYKEYEVDMLADGAGPKGSPVMTRTHAIGSAITYGKRQLLKMMFNLAEAGDDDDGQAAGKSQVLTTDQLDVVNKAIEDASMDSDDVRRLCKKHKIEGLASLRQHQSKAVLDDICDMKEWIKRQKATGFENASA